MTPLICPFPDTWHFKISTKISLMSHLQLRDLKAVGEKFVHVMYPKKSSALLRDCEYCVL